MSKGYVQRKKGSHLMRVFLTLLLALAVDTLARGISKQKPPYEWRALDSPVAAAPCKQIGSGVPNRLPRAWRSPHGSTKDCGTQIRTSKDVRDLKSPSTTHPRRSKDCKPPDVLRSLPGRLQQRILAIWEERDPKGDCWQQQRRTRLILLNLPPSLRKSLRPPALECALPHFIDRLEWDLQVKLRRLWTGYKEGQPCSKLVAKQLRLLQQHDISLESFDMPPANMFRRYQVIQKLKQTNLL